MMLHKDRSWHHPRNHHGNSFLEIAQNKDKILVYLPLRLTGYVLYDSLYSVQQKWHSWYASGIQLHLHHELSYKNTLHLKPLSLHLILQKQDKINLPLNLFQQPEHSGSNGFLNLPCGFLNLPFQQIILSTPPVLHLHYITNGLSLFILSARIWVQTKYSGKHLWQFSIKLIIFIILLHHVCSSFKKQHYMYNLPTP